MYISGVRFEDTAPIFQEIFLMQYFIVLSLLPNGIIVQKRQLITKTRYSKKENTVFLYVAKPFE